MRRPPIIATLVFALATVTCVTAAAVSAPRVGASIRPQQGDLVLFVAPRQTGACRLGEVATGRVLGLGGDTVRAGKARVGGHLRSTLLVNGELAAVMPASGAQSFARTRVASDRVFLLANGRGSCDSRVLGTVARSSLVGYTQGTLDARVGVARQQLSDRITGEKYVAAVYLLVFAGFLVYLLIHAGRFARLEQELSDVSAELNARTDQAT